MRLDGKVAIVTGAGNGIGRAIAETFGREGCRVVVTDINAEAANATAAAILAAGGAATAEALDVGERGAVQRLIQRTAAEHGSLDVMVNNAGVRGVGWNETIRVNLDGVAWGIRYAARTMAKQGHGSIISTASVGGLIGLGYPPDSGTDIYVATKHAVIGLTREFALSYGRFGVRINCVCPGSVATDMMKGALSDEGFRRRIESAVALKRSAQPQEIANVFLFLASDEASYITGAAIAVDGGVTAGSAAITPD